MPTTETHELTDLASLASDLRDAEALLRGSEAERRTTPGASVAAGRRGSEGWRYHRREVHFEGGRVKLVECLGPFHI